MSLLQINTIAKTVPANLLLEIMRYDPKTGFFVWRERPVRHFSDGKPTPNIRAAMWNGKYAGKPALTSACPRGYFRGAIGGKTIYAHRAAFAITYGRWPDKEIDHINRDKSDNKIVNLREVSHSENSLNSKVSDDSFVARKIANQKLEERRIERRMIYPISGVRRSGRKWSARIKINGKEKYLGAYSCFANAVAARLKAEI